MNIDNDLHNLDTKIINSTINQYFDISDIANNLIINHVIDDKSPSLIITSNCVFKYSNNDDILFLF